jgi:hypothetical protein
MYYYLYQITNKVNGKIYVGIHKTKSLKDGYMGSGKVIKRAIRKHGLDNFKKDILEFFENAELMYAREKEVVNEEFMAREDVYNLRRGGTGGFDYMYKCGTYHELTDADRLKAKESLRNRMLISGRTKDEVKQTIKLNIINQQRYDSGEQISVFVHLNKDVSFQHKRKERLKEINHQQGDKNSQAGTMWITDEVENKKIKKTDSIPEGFRKGRVMNNVPLAETD